MTHAMIITSLQHDPWYNLALEDYLMDMPGKQPGLRAILYLWQNENTVVIGRNQNAWAECLTGQLEAEGGKLARRSTGGGAVFHDLGNLNFSLILPRRSFRLDDNFNMIVDAVSSQGIQAERTGRNDITAGGLKFSGNAFSLRRQVGLHHGTLLVHSEYARVARYLTVNPAKLQARGVSSVRSRITNLQAINPDITVASMTKAMEDAFIGHFCTSLTGQSDTPDKTAHSAAQPGMAPDILYATDEQFAQDAGFIALHEHYASWEWRYGETIKFDALIEEKLDWGMVHLGFQIDHGRISRATIYSDALDSDFISLLAEGLTGCRFRSVDLADAVRRLTDLDGGFGTPRQQMVDDLSRLILEQNW